jgi:osmotically-inducible protein OsmY
MKSLVKFALAILFIWLATTLLAVQASAQYTKPEDKSQAQQTASTAKQTAAAPSSRTIEHSIKEEIKKDPTMAHSRVTVHVTDDEVVLSGVVLNKDAESRAIQIATDHAGSRKVKDMLKVNPNTHPGSGM